MFFVNPALGWLLLEWFLVGFTGAVVPGNVLLITVTETTQKGWKGGESIILGHCVLEILLVGSIFLGMGALWNNPTTILANVVAIHIPPKA